MIEQTLPPSDPYQSAPPCDCTPTPTPTKPGTFLQSMRHQDHCALYRHVHNLPPAAPTT
jgi:hypothetical protein